MKHCPKCGSDSNIYESRIKEGTVIRRRICKKCKWKWMTAEIDYWTFLDMKREAGEKNA